MHKLTKIIQQISGKGYKAYKSIQGTYNGGWFILHIDYVQPDPFATPSRIRFEVPKKVANYQDDWFNTTWRKTGFEDFLAREIGKIISASRKERNGSGKSGLVQIDTPGQEILPRTAVKVDTEKIEIRLSVGLPARGRSILGKEAENLLCMKIPGIIRKAVLDFDRTSLIKHLQLIDQQQAIREYIKKNGYISFIANGSILPRESGISNLPLKGSEVIPFKSPSSLEIEIPIPHRKPIKGMAIPQGVTLIVGGGYHGKSTLLKAIERGIYNHIHGDGREYVITDTTAIKIRSEDGRRIEKVNISPFISNLPYKKDTTGFSTEDASGSTSQAANIIEALEIGSQVLLMDEDTSATNFMIRDARMQELVNKEKEPITPFIDKVRQLYEEYKISTVLVIGGSGDYFDVADLVIMMDEYHPIDVTEKVKEIVNQFKSYRDKEGGSKFGEISHRIIKKESFNSFRGKKEKVDSKGLSNILYGKTLIDLSFVEQLVDPSQTRAIANMIRYLANNLVDNQTPLIKLIERLYHTISTNGLEYISPFFGQHPGDMALPRKQELAAAINRLRTLKVK